MSVPGEFVAEELARCIEVVVDTVVVSWWEGSVRIHRQKMRVVGPFEVCKEFLYYLLITY